MHKIQELFSSREIAVFIWFFLLFILASSKSKIRKSLFSVVKAGMAGKLLAYYLSFILYMLLVLGLLYIHDYWEFSLLKDTIMWFLFSGIVTGFQASTKYSENRFWSNLILDNLKLLVVLEFVISSYPFSLIAELILIPFTALIVLIDTLSAKDAQHAPVKKITTGLITIMGAIVIIHSIYMGIYDFRNFADIATLRSFIYPIFLMIISLPYLSLFVLSVQYDDIFIRLKHGQRRGLWLNIVVGINIVRFCGVSSTRLDIVKNMGVYNIMSISSKNDIAHMRRNHFEALRNIEIESE